MKRVPRLLLVAFAFSLFVHLIVAIVLRPAAPSPEGPAEVVSILHRPTTIAVTKIPTPPPPRPQQTPAPRTPSSAPPRRKGPGTAATSGGTAPAPSPVIARVTPAPTATPSQGCSDPNAAAAVIATPAPPEIAPDVRASGTNGLALVSVALDPTGQVTNTGVAQSTGNSSLDLVAVAMARDARYSPALHDCKPIAATYTFSVKFVAW
jgi:protein TonB